MNAAERTAPCIRLAQRAGAVAGDLSAARWQLAELGAEAKNANIRTWSEIISVACRKSPRRVMEWVQTFEWAEEADVLKWRAELDFTFFELARKYAVYLSVGEVVELLDTFRQEQGATAESFKKELDDLRGEPEPDPGKLYTRAVSAVKAYRDVADGRGHAAAEQALVILEKVNQP